MKIHSNPFLVDRASDHKRKQARQIGREALVTRVAEEVLDYFEQPESPYILAVLGEVGSGKTLFGRVLIEKIKKRKDLLWDCDQHMVLTSALNAESQMKFLNIWRPPL